MKNKILEIENANTNILKNINLNLKKGEVHALIGLSGSGKRHLIQGLIGKMDLNGELTYKNKNLKFNLHSLKDESIDFIFETPVFFDDLSIAENFSANNLPLTRFIPFISNKKVQKKCESILNSLDLDISNDTKVRTLSIKEKKFLYIAKVFNDNPDVIIMYEPSAGLDGEYIHELHNFILDFKKQGGSIIYISKHWEEALKIADRISVLSEGRIVGT